MRILALDTACDRCTLVLSENGARVDARSVVAGREQAKLLAPLTEEFLKANKTSVAALDKLSVCTGPGSFTGLRISLSFARGLGLAAKKPVHGFDHFTCTLHALKRLGLSQDVLIIRDSKREEMFAQLNGVRFLATLDQLAGKLRAGNFKFTGNAAPLLLEKFPEFQSRFVDLAPEEIAFSATLLAENATPEQAPAEPLYLREADVTFPKA